jgi:hypothetical protein
MIDAGMAFEDAFQIAASAGDAHGAAIRSRYTVGGAGLTQGERRIEREAGFHDKVQSSVWPDDQSEVVRLRVLI